MLDSVKGMPWLDTVKRNGRLGSVSRPTTLRPGNAAADLPAEGRAGGARDALLRAARAELALTGAGAISLRAIARRAGVSHAAPKYHFGDRAGLLTALAVDGFRVLSAALEQAAYAASDAPDDQLAALGLAYVDTGLADPALFELMFRPELLDRDDPDLREAQRATFDLLGSAFAEDGDPARTADAQSRTDSPPVGALPLIAWAFVHGLVVLARNGAIQAAAVPDGTDTGLLLHRLTEVFASRLRPQPDQHRP
jgi:AcrR family transcriptional regulator